MTSTPTPLHPVATTQAGEPIVPRAIINAITQYGDSRADNGLASGPALANVIAVIREHLATQAADAAPFAWAYRAIGTGEWRATMDARWATCINGMESMPLYTHPSTTTAPASESIDTDAFFTLLNDWHTAPGSSVDKFNELVAHINAHTAAQVAASKPAEDLHYNAQRLRNVAKLVGMKDSAIPADDATLDGARGAVLGMIASHLRGKPAAASGEAVTEGYVLALQTVVEMPDGKKELGYTLLSDIGIFTSREEVSAAIAELSLPLGWVSMTTSQLLPGWMLPATPPAQAPALPAKEVAGLTLEDYVERADYKLSRARACRTRASANQFIDEARAIIAALNGGAA